MQNASLRRVEEQALQEADFLVFTVLYWRKLNNELTKWGLKMEQSIV